MKYIVILGDGMADLPVKELGNRTPLDVAKKPNIDFMSENGILGLVKTVPDHLNPPGSDIANMAVMGYDPDVYYSGRSPLEAASLGIDLAPDDLAVRCNLVTLSEDEPYDQKTMVDYSSDEISTEEAAKLIDTLRDELFSKYGCFKIYSGFSYRHCLVYKIPDKISLGCTPPHDISGRKITNYMPKNDLIREITLKSYDILKNHPVNVSRRERGLRPANSVWLWGEGRKPNFDSFESRFRIKGAVVSAVDLLKGLGKCAGLEVLNVEGATGTYITNYEGKVEAALDFLRNRGDFVYIHMEGPDECGHRHEIDNKVTAIESIDAKVAGPILKVCREEFKDFRILVMPDHPTPLDLRTHTHDPIPFTIYGSDIKTRSGLPYNESTGASTGLYCEKGYNLIETLFK